MLASLLDESAPDGDGWSRASAQAGAFNKMPRQHREDFARRILEEYPSLAFPTLVRRSLPVSFILNARALVPFDLVDINQTTIIAIGVIGDNGVTFGLRKLYLLLQLVWRSPQLQDDIGKYFPGDTRAINGRVGIISLALDLVLFSFLVEIAPARQLPANTYALLFCGHPAAPSYQQPPMGLGHLPVPTGILAWHEVGVYLLPALLGILIMHRTDSLKSSNLACWLTCNRTLVNEDLAVAKPLGNILY